MTNPAPATGPTVSVRGARPSRRNHLCQIGCAFFGHRMRWVLLKSTTQTELEVCRRCGAWGLETRLRAPP